MKKILSLALTLTLTLTLISCSRGQQIPVERSLYEYYTIAHRHLARGNPRFAAEEFLNAERSFPASPWAADALIMAAYSAYRDRDFPGVILTTDRFMRFHPGHANVDYVLYLRGMAFFRQTSDVRREQGMSVLALQTFSQLVERFPNTEYAENARNKIVILQNYLAGKLMHSARREMARQNWPSAIDHLQNVILNFQETVMTPEALFRLHESYRAIGLTSQSDSFADMLRLNFPDNEWVRKL
ncbi:MAG: outer membrane protein assembly factor BamD [Alphaproteobacteria bacterium]|nr:outer membrane protein assembly factor BamD [Alphaproteobacteria bacterium]